MNSKPLAQNDIEQGVALQERHWAALQEATNANALAAQAETDLIIYINVMRSRYDAPQDKWTVTDWQQGFVPVESGDSDG